MVIGVKLKSNIKDSNRFERNFLFFLFIFLFRNPLPPPPLFFYNKFFFFQNQNNKNFSFFFLLQASGLNILDVDFRPDFRKENNSSFSSIRLEYFKRRFQAGFYNRVQASGF